MGTTSEPGAHGMCLFYLGRGYCQGGRRAWQGFTWAVGPGLALIPSLTCLYSLVHVLYAAAIQPGGGSRG